MSDPTLRVSSVEDLNANGFSTLTTQAHQDVIGNGVWEPSGSLKGGGYTGPTWRVVVKRPLETGDANDTQMILHTHAILGEVLAFRLGKETILLRTGWSQFDVDKTALIDQTITCHIDLILQGLTQRSLES